MLQPSNGRSGLRPSKVVTYGVTSLVAVLVVSAVLHAILGLVWFVIDAVVVVALVAFVLRLFGFGRRN